MDIPHTDQYTAIVEGHALVWMDGEMLELGPGDIGLISVQRPPQLRGRSGRGLLDRRPDEPPLGAQQDGVPS